MFGAVAVGAVADGVVAHGAAAVGAAEVGAVADGVVAHGVIEEDGKEMQMLKIPWTWYENRVRFSHSYVFFL